jgi:hypothetical protein
MKKHPLIGIFGFLTVAGLCFAAGPPAKDRPPKIEDCIQFPGTHLTQAQVDKIIKILQKDTKYPRNYRVRVWSNGQMTQEIGKLEVKKAVVSETDKYAKTSGLTSVTIQVGICDVRAFSCSTDCIPFWDAGRLIEEISPILKKYRK